MSIFDQKDRICDLNLPEIDHYMYLFYEKLQVTLAILYLSEI